MKHDVLFLDANVLFSAAYRENSGLLKFWQLETVSLISSPYAVEEARRNLGQREQRTRLDSLLLQVDLHLEEITTTLSKTIQLKEKDKPILLAAIQAKADYLITGDLKDFGPFYGKKVEGVMILPPAQYLNIHG